MEFITAMTFWLLCIPVLIICGVATFTSMHPKILKRNPTALALNNLMIIVGIGCLITIFVVHSWLAGGICLILAIIVFGIAGRLQERIFFRNLTDEAKRSSKKKTANEG